MFYFGVFYHVMLRHEGRKCTATGLKTSILSGDIQYILKNSDLVTHLIILCHHYLREPLFKPAESLKFPQFTMIVRYRNNYIKFKIISNVQSKKNDNYIDLSKGSRSVGLKNVLQTVFGAQKLKAESSVSKPFRFEACET